MSNLERAIEALTNATRVVCFTGAGASASAGLHTFRGQNAGNMAQVREDGMDQVFPNVTYKALSALVASSFVDFVISSNHDNLVRKAGVPDDRLAELFGNAYVEMCLKCKQPFQRSTITPALGRKCESCRGRLVKTGVRYGQEIPAEPYRRAQEEARTQPAGTVSLVLGSGMHTSPIPDFSLMSQRVVVVNLGPTACDGHRRVLKVESSTDDFMQALCGALGVDIPPFVFRQAFRVAVRAADDGDDELKVSVTAARTNESVTFARGVEILPLRDGCVAELVEPDLHWQFQARVRRADRVRVTLLPRSEYDGAAPIVVELDATTPTEQECEFVHSV